jgi:hypothetical protein
MRYFLDTEFAEQPPRDIVSGVLANHRPGSIDLISLGIAAEDGRKLHEISLDFNPDNANAWVKANVLPLLPPPSAIKRRKVADIGKRVVEFVGGDRKPEFWAYYADYDWVAFCWLQGSMIQLPQRWPKFCLDLRQACHHLGMVRAELPPDPPRAHDALEDAIWLQSAFAIVQKRAEARGLIL